MTFFCVSDAAPCQSQTKPKTTTVWVAPKTGSLLGGGYVATGETTAVAKKSSINSSTAAEDPSLRAAIAKLNANAGTTVDGYTLIVDAVAYQTKIPAATLRRQRAATGLSMADLLVANSLAGGSGKTFDAVLAMRSKKHGWGDVAKQLGINPKSIVARANEASESLLYAEARRRNRRDQNLQDNDIQRAGRTRVPGGG